MELDSVEIINPEGKFPCLLVCDHASAFIPDAYGNLGLGADVLNQHVAVDKGIAPVVRAMSHLLDAPAVLAKQSRLLIDTNRWIADPESIPEHSDAIEIPGNAELTPQERQQRQDQFFWPFHEAVARQLEKMRSRHGVTYFLAAHSCTRKLNTGVHRQMDGGTIWHEHAQFANKVADLLAQNYSLTVACNEPYSGIGGVAFTIDYHTWGTGSPAFGFEIVNDAIEEPAGQELWARRLANVLRQICDNPESLSNSAVQQGANA